MTGINTLEAAKHWNEERGGEIGYLKAICYVSPELDEEGNLYVSLQGDEEGNFDTRLTTKAAKWLAKELLKFAIDIEKDPDAWKKAIKEAKEEQERNWVTSQ